MDAINDNADKALLPAGMGDVLPPDAAFEADVVEQLMAAFGAHGYDRVKPPLLEFEQNLLRGPGAAMGAQTFRLMDPVSQRMMGLRADITPQVARIATTRLRNAPRPLRLSYAGQILRVKGTQLRGERQFGQVGAELIGADTPAAHAEIILMAAGALGALGVKDMSVDICLPTLVPAVCRDFGLAEESQIALRDALDRKDAAEIAGLGNVIGADAAELFGALLAAMGPASDTLSALDKLDFGTAAKAECAALKAVVTAVQSAAPDLVLTTDPVENRGWEYHTGVTYTFFTRGVRGELGAGGSYMTNEADDAEPSSGLTLFTDTLLRAIPKATPAQRVYMPMGSSHDDASALRAQGWVTVQGLDDASDINSEAKRLGCGHVFDNGAAQPLA